MKSKRGMSAIVTTVILVALALIAVGIVWAVIQNLIESSKDDILINEKCLGVSLTKVYDDPPFDFDGLKGNSTLIIKRGIGNGDIDGVRGVGRSEMEKGVIISTTFFIEGNILPSNEKKIELHDYFDSGPLWGISNITFTPYFTINEENITCAGKTIVWEYDNPYFPRT